MERKAFSVTHEKNPNISIQVIPGHFTTSNAHCSHYLDVYNLTSNAVAARNVARELAIPYLSRTPIDTIVCMENTKVIGAYLAEELNASPGIDGGNEIHVITPLSNTAGNFIFYESELIWVADRNILLLTASVSSGGTLNRALECLAYYGGRVAGISALFLVSPNKQNINALFTSDDIAGYKLSRTDQCDMCAAGRKLDAIISSEGYTKIPG